MLPMVIAMSEPPLIYDRRKLHLSYDSDANGVMLLLVHKTVLSASHDTYYERLELGWIHDKAWEACDPKEEIVISA
jgi:hypothetical protein